MTSIDISDGRILVNVDAVDAEYHAARALLVDFGGKVVDLSAQDELALAAAAFLER